MDTKEFPPPYSEKSPGIGFNPPPAAGQQYAPPDPNQPQQAYAPQPAYSPYPPQQAYPNAPVAQQPGMMQQPMMQQPVMMQQPMMQTNAATPMMITSTGGHHGPTMVTAMPIIGNQSVRMKCPHCQSDVDTSTAKSPTMIAYAATIGLFMLGCVCGCCLVPLCIDDCKSVEHSCPSCRRFLGKYQKF